MSAFRRPTRLVLAAPLAVALAAPVAVSASVAPTWSTAHDGGFLADDTVQFVERSESLNNGRDLVFVAGTAHQSDLQSARQDRDVLLSAFDSATGELVWDQRYDCGLWQAQDAQFSLDPEEQLAGSCTTPFTDEELVGFSIDRTNNTVGSFVVNLGNGVVQLQKFALSSGSVTSRGSVTAGFEVEGAHANAYDSRAGSWGGIVGSKDGHFWATSHALGGDKEIFEHLGPIGEALAVDNEYFWQPYPAPSHRSMTVTGRQSTNGGDILTTNHDYRTTRSSSANWTAQAWDGPESGKDEGVAVTQGWIDGFGPVSFVAGRSWSPVSRDWDLVVLAYDNTNGNLLWQDLYDGEAGGDDQPVALTYSRAAQRLYVAGTTERGVPHGQDVLVRAYDVAAGHAVATTFASGDIANGDDQVMDLAVSEDGDRVFLLAEAHNFLHTGGHVAAVFGYDADLRPAGSSVVTEGHVGQAHGGITLGHPSGSATDVIVGTKAVNASTGDLDQLVQRLPLADFVVQTVQTVISLTDQTDVTVVAGDDATVQALLVDDAGAPVVGQEVTLGLGPATSVVATDGDGLATARFDTTGLHGTYAVTADFAGGGVLEPSQTTSSVEIAKLATSIAFTDQTTGGAEVGDTVTVQARLLDEQGQPIVDTWVDLTFADAVAAVRTDESGVAEAGFDTEGLEAGEHDATASFGGDGRHEPSNAQTTIALAVAVPDFFASASATKKGVTLVASATSEGDDTFDVQFDVDWFQDERPGHGKGAKEREAAGVRDLSITVETLVDDAWVELTVLRRPEVRMFADAGTEIGPDWHVQAEAISQAGTHRVLVDGVLLDADGADLNGRGVKVEVLLG